MEHLKDLKKIIKARTNKKVIGFGAEVQKQDSMGTEGEFFKKSFTRRFNETRYYSRISRKITCNYYS